MISTTYWKGKKKSCGGGLISVPRLYDNKEIRKDFSQVLRDFFDIILHFSLLNQTLLRNFIVDLRAGSPFTYFWLLATEW
jgi:hypothetical protein